MTLAMPTLSLPSTSPTPDAAPLAIEVHRGTAALDRIGPWQSELGPAGHPAHDLRWLTALSRGLGHAPIVVEARAANRLTGLLPLALVQSPWFGRFLVSLPYVNSAGILPVGSAAEKTLVDRAVGLADELNVRYLELRGEREIVHPSLAETSTAKVHMRLALPATTDALMAGFKSKLRSQIKGALKHDFQIAWGGRELVGDFYRVFAHNMRDLGTPVYPRGFFAAILEAFPVHAELCVVRLAGQPVAAALLVHGQSITEVPSASSLRSLNSSGANMVLYWHLLVRAIERGQATFDFGRSSEGSGTYKFKQQWGAQPSPAIWQYYVRRGSSRAMRPDNGNFSLAIRLWQKLPLWLANAAGPSIVRGIP